MLCVIPFRSSSGGGLQLKRTSLHVEVEGTAIRLVGGPGTVEWSFSIR